jgi:VIT1/CCC1 family predicted Fe2+/Mn2+ transporter
MTAIAGALSMAAGAYVATSSQEEVARTERRRREFLRSRDTGPAPVASAPDPPDAASLDRESADSGPSPLRSAFAVGASYLAGAVIPVLPVAAGATSALVPLLVGGSVVVIVSLVLAFLSGMDVTKRITMNLAIVAAAVAVTYLSGLLLNRVAGVVL